MIFISLEVNERHINFLSIYINVWENCSKAIQTVW